MVFKNAEIRLELLDGLTFVLDLESGKAKAEALRGSAYANGLGSDVLQDQLDEALRREAQAVRSFIPQE